MAGMPLRMIVASLERQAGLIGLLTLRSMGYEVMVITKDPYIAELVKNPLQSIHSPEAHEIMKQADLFVNVHGREILTPDELAMPKYGCINIHPCLWKYPGMRPIRRLLADGGTFASVAAHIMTERVDVGPILEQRYTDINGLKTEVEVYNQLYYFYPRVILQAVPEMYCLMGNQEF